MVATRKVARVLVDRHGATYSEQAGIRLKNTPGSLYQLLVLSTLLSARISADIAVAAAVELFRAGCRTPRAMREATWQQRVEALGRGGYRRYDEKTSIMLGNGAELAQKRWRNDLRRLYAAGGDSAGVARLLREFPGIGPTGASIFCREVQGVWTDLAPYVDERALKGAERLGLPTDAERLARLVDDEELPNLIAGCVRVALSPKLADEVTRA
ncbi:MAG: endonuclease [Stackebrandtia sp.]